MKNSIKYKNYIDQYTNITIRLFHLFEVLSFHYIILGTQMNTVIKTYYSEFFFFAIHFDVNKTQHK